MPDELENLIRSIPDDKLLRTEIPFSGKTLTQGITPAVRIKLPVLQGELGRRYRPRGRSEWILVRRELDDRRRIQTQLARHFLNRFAGLVDGLG